MLLPLVLLFVHYCRMIPEEAVLIPSNTCEQDTDRGETVSAQKKPVAQKDFCFNEKSGEKQKKKKERKKETHKENSPFFLKYGFSK